MLNMLAHMFFIIQNEKLYFVNAKYACTNLYIFAKYSYKNKVRIKEFEIIK